jgi:hypothetical protein
LVGPKAANSPIKPGRRFEQTNEPDAHLFETARPAPRAPDEAEPLSETADSQVKPDSRFDQTGDPDTHLFETSHYVPHLTDGIAPPEPAATAQHQTSYVEKKAGESSTSSIEESTPRRADEFAAGRARLTPTLKSRDDMRDLISEPTEASRVGVNETYATEPAAPPMNAGPGASDSLEGQERAVPPHERADSNLPSQIGIESLDPQAEAPARHRRRDNEIDTAYIKIPGSLYGQQSLGSDLIQDKPGHETQTDSHAVKADQTSPSGSIKPDRQRPQFETEVMSSATGSRLLTQAEKPKPTAMTFPGLGSTSKDRGPVRLQEVADAIDRRLDETDRSGLELAKERGHVSEISREAIRSQADLVPGKTREKLPVATASATPSPRVDSDPRLKINSLEIKIINDVRDRTVRSEAQRSSTRISREPTSMLERRYHRHFDLIY